MNHYINVLKKYATFSGRATRSEYWYFVLIYSITYTILMGIDLAIGTFSQEFMDKESFVGFLSTAYSLILFLPSLAVTVRRLHDINKSGWWILLIFIPIIGFILLLIYLCTNSKEDNKYGVSLKNSENEENKNSSTQKVFIISTVFVLFLVILGAFIGLKDKFNDFSFVKTENKFGIKEINNLINLNDDFKTSCEKLRMLSPDTYTITPGESYYWCSINDGNINLISYDNKTVDGFVTTFNYKGFQNLSIEEVKKLFRKKGYEEFSKESAEWVSFNKIESLVLKIDDFQQITYLSLDKYIQNKNKVSKNLTKVRDYVHSINKAITVGEAFGNFQDCKNHTWEELITSNNREMVQFTCDILSEKKFVDDNISKFKQNNIKISPILLMTAMAEDIKEVNFDAQYMKIANFKMIVQFTINRDNTIDVSYLGRQIEWENGERFSPSVSKDYIENILANVIYPNKNFFEFNSELVIKNQMEEVGLAIYGIKKDDIYNFEINKHFDNYRKYYLTVAKLDNNTGEIKQNPESVKLEILKRFTTSKNFDDVYADVKKLSNEYVNAEIKLNDAFKLSKAKLDENSQKILKKEQRDWMIQRNQNALNNAQNGWDSFINGLISDTESRATQVSKFLN
ncbi:DUF805 domain-containing protein [Aliarcobacter butzleri]|uniref:DUF805 domain-containing protein n=1 Tax=Aliarcobacter butzleri TaxID=28197 RepID=A0AAW7PVC4_9BACT|nr:DUF805 domain-containing protein [Aliarcobacter butzleri]MDN5069894.1 DUF805 domain-containing protein [Aliarcobacter butzleri]